MNCYRELKQLEGQRVSDENHTRNFKTTHSSFLGDSGSPLSSISIPSPPSVSPTPEMYNKQHLYNNVSQLDVQNQCINKDDNFQDSRAPASFNATSASNHSSDQRNYKQVISDCYPRTTTKTPIDLPQLRELLDKIHALKEFLLTAPNLFKSPNDFIFQFKLPTEEKISCVYWDRFCITGTDIVRILAYRFTLFGREIVNRKKFEEGIFSDLRNLKINVDARLENPKSELLEYLYKRHCVRTKKKQKVFFWHSVHHDQLFIDALERELKKEFVKNSEVNPSNQYSGSNSAASTVALREPALSFKYDASLPLTEQLVNSGERICDEYSGLVSELISSTISASSKPRNEIVTSINENAHQNIPLGSIYNSENPSLVSYRDNILFGEDRFSNKTETPKPPYTPVQQMISDTDVSSLLTPYEKLRYESNKQDLEGSFIPRQLSQQQYNLYSHHLMNEIPMSSQDSNGASVYQNVYQTPPRNNSPMRRAQESNSENYKDYSSRSAFKQTSPPTSFTQESDDADSDFPLFDVLTKVDGHPGKSSEQSHTFESRYTDFAHHNRPALSHQNNGSHLLVHDGLYSPYDSSFGLDSSLLNYNYPSQSGLSLQSGVSHQAQAQLSDMNHFISAEPRNVPYLNSKVNFIQENNSGVPSLPLNSPDNTYMSSTINLDRVPTSKYSGSENARVTKSSSLSRKKSNTQQQTYLPYINEEF